MVGRAELAQRGRAHQLKEAQASPAVFFTLKIDVRLWQNGMSRVSYGAVTLYVGVDEPLKIRRVSLELFQVAVRLIAGKSRRHHERRVAEQVILHVRLIDDPVFCAAENLLDQLFIGCRARQLSNGDFL